MDDVLAALLFADDATPAERAAFRAALAADPALAEAAARWQRVCAAVRTAWRADLPERSLLVLYALDGYGRRATLAGDERTALDAARTALEQALAAHPALEDIIRRIQDDAEAFEATWAQHITEAPPPGSAAAPRPPVRAPAARRTTRQIWRIGTLVLLVGFVTVLSLLLQRDRNQVTVATAAGEVQVLTLADGSSVRLLENSSLTYPEPGKTAFNRRVHLQGRAYFNIVPAQQGFTVETTTALTTVLGTRFGVQADDALTEVVLETGRVSLAPRAAQEQLVVLEPGEMSRVAANALPSTPTPVNVTAALAWTGLFIFRATPLPDMATRLAEHYGAAVTFAPTLAADSVNGTFAPEEGLEGILRIISPTLNADVRATPQGFELVPQGR